jgi:predicted MFS family arabinose efflux permease
MLCSEIGRGAAITTIVVALALGKPSVILLTVAAAIEEILEVFSTLAERRFVRALVKPNQVPSALARTEGRTHMVILIGRPLGGFFFGIWRILPFAADVVSFIVSVSTLFCIQGRARPIPSEPVERRHLGRELTGGFRWLFKNPFAGVALPLTAGATFIGQALIMVFLVEAHVRHLPSVSTGIVLAASGAGGVLASVAGFRLFPWKNHSPLKIQMLIWMLTFGLLAISGGQSFVGLAVTMAILGFTGALGNIAVDTFVIRNTAKSMLARVMSVNRLASFGALALGPLFGGILVDHQGPRGAIFMLFLVTAFLLAVALIALPSADLTDSASKTRNDEEASADLPAAAHRSLEERATEVRRPAIARCGSHMRSAKASQTRVTYLSPIVSGGCTLITFIWSSESWMRMRCRWHSVSTTIWANSRCLAGRRVFHPVRNRNRHGLPMSKPSFSPRLRTSASTSYSPATSRSTSRSEFPVRSGGTDELLVP